jgi:hypothetical protein
MRPSKGTSIEIAETARGTTIHCNPRNSSALYYSIPQREDLDQLQRDITVSSKG